MNPVHLPPNLQTSITYHLPQKETHTYHLIDRPRCGTPSRVWVQEGKKGLRVSVQQGAVHELQKSASSPYIKLEFVYSSARRDYGCQWQKRKCNKGLYTNFRNCILSLQKVKVVQPGLTNITSDTCAGSCTWPCPFWSRRTSVLAAQLSPTHTHTQHTHTHTHTKPAISRLS